MSRVAKDLIKNFIQYLGIPPYIVRELLFELRCMIVRSYAALPFQNRRIKKLLSESNEINLNFGCGVTSYPGWVGIDSFFANYIDIVLDLRRPLPFPDASISLCYSEHFIEHLTPEEGMLHLKQVCRILKPGGVYRIVVPAGIRFVKKYLDGDHDFFKLAFPWEERPMDAIWHILIWGGEHKNIFDFSQFEYIGKKAGFTHVLESSANCSSNVFLRIDKNYPQRIAESLYVELKKG